MLLLLFIYIDIEDTWLSDVLVNSEETTNSPVRLVWKKLPFFVFYDKENIEQVKVVSCIWSLKLECHRSDEVGAWIENTDHK